MLSRVPHKPSVIGFSPCAFGAETGSLTRCHVALGQWWPRDTLATGSPGMSGLPDSALTGFFVCVVKVRCAFPSFQNSVVLGKIWLRKF